MPDIVVNKEESKSQIIINNKPNPATTPVPSGLRPRPERPSGSADGLHRGSASAHALLRRRGGLPVKIRGEGQLALRTPTPAPLLLPDPQHRSG